MLVPHNLIADARYPLLCETRVVDPAATAPLEWGSCVSIDWATSNITLVSAATLPNLYGVTRDAAMPGESVVCYISGAFIADTLKSGPDVDWVALKRGLRDLGIYARVAVDYPSEVNLSPLNPLEITSKGAAAGPLGDHVATESTPSQ